MPIGEITSDPQLLSHYAYNELYVKYKDAGPTFLFCFMAICMNFAAIPGILMNSSVVFITIKYKTLRGTSSFLLALNAFYEVVHQLVHLVFLVMALSGWNFLPYLTVFYLVGIPVWGCSSSIATIAFTGLDRLLQLSYPRWHAEINRIRYLGSIVACTLFCGFLIFCKFWDIAIRYPDFPQTGTISDVFLFEFKPLFFVYMGVLNTLSILFYIGVGVIVKKQTAETVSLNSDTKTNSRLFRSMLVIVSVTIGAYLLTAVVRLIILPPLGLDQIKVWMIEFAFGTLLNLGVALNAPVLYICSKEYRKCYNREFSLIGALFGVGQTPSTIHSTTHFTAAPTSRIANLFRMKTTSRVQPANTQTDYQQTDAP